MRITNTNYVAPALAPSKQPAFMKHAAAVIEAVRGDTAKATLTPDEVRLIVGVDEKALPNGAIHEICISAGFPVEV